MADASIVETFSDPHLTWGQTLRAVTTGVTIVGGGTVVAYLYGGLGDAMIAATGISFGLTGVIALSSFIKTKVRPLSQKEIDVSSWNSLEDEIYGGK